MVFSNVLNVYLKPLHCVYVSDESSMMGAVYDKIKYLIFLFHGAESLFSIFCCKTHKNAFSDYFFCTVFLIYINNVERLDFGGTYLVLSLFFLPSK